MKETRKMTDQEFEKLLKDKMNELSDSVNCFGKISERVCHESDAEYEENDFVVTDLENITGKKRYSPILKGLAAGIAAVFAITVIPKTGIYRKALCNIGARRSNTYSSLVNSIMYNTSEESGMEFSTYDLALEDYIKKSVLITPLYSCPFEDIGREDVRVRIFVRSYRDRLTNQIYAVEYSGEFAEENFIAAAETKAEFSQDELNSAFISYKEFLLLSSYNTFYGDENDQNVIAASFVQYGLFKEFNEVYPLDSMILYSTDDDGESYSYTVNNYRITDNGRSIDTVEIPQTELKWKCSFYADGESALPKDDGSVFIKNTDVHESEVEPVSFKPYENVELSVPSSQICSDIASINLGHIGKNIDIPSDISARSHLTVYLNEYDMMYFYCSSESDPKIELSSSDDSVSKIYRAHDLDVDKHLSALYDGSTDNDILMQNSDSYLFGDMQEEAADFVENAEDFLQSGESDDFQEYVIMETENEDDLSKSIFIQKK